MNKIALAAVAIALSSAAACAIGKKIFADHSHRELGTSGPFDTSHSGGLDRFGGHYDHRNGGYHYHR